MFHLRFAYKAQPISKWSCKQRKTALRKAIEALENRVLLAYTLDPSFGGDGMIETPKLENVAVMADNKIMGATITSYVEPYKVTLYRYNANGAPDTTYGAGGARTSTV